MRAPEMTVVMIVTMMVMMMTMMEITMMMVFKVYLTTAFLAISP